MKKLLALSVLVGCATSSAASAGQLPSVEDGAVSDQGTAKPEVLERDEQGRVTKVKVDGFVVDVCTPERTDGCVNPREIGLDQGNKAIGYWPGKPASEIDQPLPPDKPEAKTKSE